MCTMQPSSDLHYKNKISFLLHLSIADPLVLCTNANGTWHLALGNAPLDQESALITNASSCLVKYEIFCLGIEASITWCNWVTSVLGARQHIRNLSV